MNLDRPASSHRHIEVVANSEALKTLIVERVRANWRLLPSAGDAASAKAPFRVELGPPVGDATPPLVLCGSHLRRAHDVNSCAILCTEGDEGDTGNCSCDTSLLRMYVGTDDCSTPSEFLEPPHQPVVPLIAALAGALDPHRTWARHIVAGHKMKRPRGDVEEEVVLLRKE